MQRAAPVPSRKVCLKPLPSPPSKADAKSHVRQSQQRQGGQAPGRAGGCQRGHRLKTLLDIGVLKFFINLGAHNNIDFGGRHVRSKYCSGYSVTHHLCPKYLCPKSKNILPWLFSIQFKPTDAHKCPGDQPGESPLLLRPCRRESPSRTPGRLGGDPAAALCFVAFPAKKRVGVSHKQPVSPGGGKHGAEKGCQAWGTPVTPQFRAGATAPRAKEALAPGRTPSLPQPGGSLTQAPTRAR